MISLESYSFRRYGSLLKKLMLGIFCLFEYIFYYHPVNIDMGNMLEILHATQQNKHVVLSKEKELCRYTLHQTFLII